MKLTSCAILSLIACSFAVASCTQSNPTQLSEDVSAVTETPNFTSEIVALSLGDANDIRFGIQNCQVYKDHSGNDEWELLFKPAPYPLTQQCIRERLEFDGEYIQIEIGTQALGAGGCCTNYAAYRSKDGENWEIRPATSITEWQSLNSTEP